MKELSLAGAISALQQGGVIAYPTEAVWGLGCDPRQRGAVMRLLELKRRPPSKGVIVVAASLEPLRPWLDLAALPADRLADVLGSWPGPHTWVLPASEHAPSWVTGDHASLAVRISAHPLVTRLCQAWQAPLVSTSANLAGQPPARTREGLDPALLQAIDGVLDGETGGLAQPTQIRVAMTGEVLRD